MIVFGSKTRSYKDLPLRLSDTDMLHRYERSGTLNGLLRARSFRQDDSHNFITHDQIKSEYAAIFEIANKFYGIFDLKFRFRLGTRPESFIGDIETWNKAESQLKEILEESGREYFIEEGDGAFYGPKVDILMKDSIGRDWQMGTIQLDFQLPRRFNLSYIDSDGKEQTPVVVHRVIYGSLERFMGILTEHTAGAFPLWLAPIQVKIIPISDKFNDYATKISQELEKQNIRVEIDTKAETMGNKIRKAQEEKIPYMLVIGEKEVNDNKVSVRTRDGKQSNLIELEGFTQKLRTLIIGKSLICDI
jgi:threonyl-tRNA synthetase